MKTMNRFSSAPTPIGKAHANTNTSPWALLQMIARCWMGRRVVLGLMRGLCVIFIRKFYFPYPLLLTAHPPPPVDHAFERR